MRNTTGLDEKYYWSRWEILLVRVVSNRQHQGPKNYTAPCLLDNVEVVFEFWIWRQERWDVGSILCTVSPLKWPPIQNCCSLRPSNSNTNSQLAQIEKCAKMQKLIVKWTSHKKGRPNHWLLKREMMKWKIRQFCTSVLQGKFLLKLLCSSGAEGDTWCL